MWTPAKERWGHQKQEDVGDGPSRSLQRGHLGLKTCSLQNCERIPSCCCVPQHVTLSAAALGPRREPCPPRRRSPTLRLFGGVSVALLRDALEPRAGTHSPPSRRTESFTLSDNSSLVAHPSSFQEVSSIRAELPPLLNHRFLIQLPPLYLPAFWPPFHVYGNTQQARATCCSISCSESLCEPGKGANPEERTLPLCRP